MNYMPLIEPPKKGKERTSKSEKNYFSQCLRDKLREVVTTNDGRQMSVAQAVTERLVAIAMFAESNQDAISASRIIFDRVEGKPAVIKDNSVKEIPKVMIRLNDSQFDKIEKNANTDFDEEDEDPDSLVVAELDGKTYIG